MKNVLFNLLENLLDSSLTSNKHTVFILIQSMEDSTKILKFIIPESGVLVVLGRTLSDGL